MKNFLTVKNLFFAIFAGLCGVIIVDSVVAILAMTNIITIETLQNFSLLQIAFSINHDINMAHLHIHMWFETVIFIVSSLFYLLLEYRSANKNI